VVGFEDGGEVRAGRAPGHGRALRGAQVDRQAPDVGVARDEAVEAQVLAHEQTDQDRGRQGDGQAADVDGGVEPVARQIAQARQHHVAQHAAASLLTSVILQK
jgi:hypothetical protein